MIKVSNWGLTRPNIVVSQITNETLLIIDEDTYKHLFCLNLNT